jgi:hypothetical protein
MALITRLSHALASCFASIYPNPDSSLRLDRCTGTIRLLPVFAALLMLGGCATASLNLSKAELDSIRIERIDVVYAENAHISWEKVETDYVEQVKATDPKAKPWKQVMAEDVEKQKNRYQELVNSPEGRAHIRGRLTSEIQTRLGRTLNARFQGTRPVVVEVTVQGFVIPGPVQRVVLGGSPMIGAVTVLKDAKTGAVLAKMDRAAAAYAGNGLTGVLIDQALPDLEERLFSSYQTQVLDWLTVT